VEESAGRSVRGRAGGVGFGEVDLGGESGDADTAGVPPTESQEFDQIPLEGAARANSAAAVDAALDTALPPRVATPSAPPDGVRKAPGPRTPTRAPAGKRTGLYVGLGLLGAVVVGGAALALTSAGAFGTRWFDERMHGAERHAAAQRAMDTAARAFEDDTYARARRGLSELEAQIGRTPDERTLAAFDAFAHYWVLARFGNDGTLAGRARTLFDRVNTFPAGVPYVAAARAVRELAAGHPERAARASRGDPAVADVVTMALLEGDDPAAAQDAAHGGLERHPSPRARFLNARALYASGDHAAARREAEALVAASPDHAGARLLLARILSERPEGADRAVALCGEVEQMNGRASPDERVEAAVLLGQTELGRDHVRPAREAFDRALAIDPRSSAALHGAGMILYRQGSYADALARFQAARSADDSDVDARLGIAMASLALNQAADARQVLQPLIDAHSTDARVHFWTARAMAAMGEQSAAETEYREALRLDNTNLDAYTLLATLLYGMQRPDAAEQVLTDARAHVSDVAAVHRALGEGRAARGDLVGAETELRAAVQGRATDNRARFLLAQVLRRLRRFDDAQRELDAIEHGDPDYPGLLTERGTLAEERGDAQGALATFRAALARDENNTELRVRVAAALVATGQYAEADTQLAPFIAEHPNLAEAHFILGRARLAQGSTADAVRLLERATELDATRADMRAYAAQANLERGQFVRALEQANNAIALDPNYARSYWVRGEVRVRQGQVREGQADALNALRLDPTFTEAMVTLADADEAQAHLPEAVILYRNALQRRPNAGEWHQRLGRILADLGRLPEATAELQRATGLGDALNPPPPWLAQAHRQLGDLQRDREPAEARRHYHRFLELAAPGAAGVADVRRALAELER
jgi:tetratricopeptide (TPR) repeat protein